jgi:hypothetical protein
MKSPDVAGLLVDAKIRFALKHDQKLLVIGCRCSVPSTLPARKTPAEIASPTARGLTIGVASEHAVWAIVWRVAVRL